MAPALVVLYLTNQWLGITTGLACLLLSLALASRFETRVASIVPIVATVSLAVFTAIDWIPASHTPSILAATLGLAAAGVMAWMSSRGLFSRLSHRAVALFVPSRV